MTGSLVRGTDAEIDALRDVIAALRELDPQSRDRVIETAKVFCNGLARKPRRGRPKKRNGAEQAVEQLLKPELWGQAE